MMAEPSVSGVHTESAMPFGPYKDFESCVARNGDKDDPSAYCAVVKKRVESAEGKRPLAFSETNDGVTWINGVPIFSAGKHTDSRGRSYTWTERDLDDMIVAFNDMQPIMIPLKFGHTDATFTEQISHELGIPIGLLRGHKDGRGAAALGEIVGLSRTGVALFADLMVNRRVAHLIKQGVFKAVSAEIEPDYRGYKHAISALAILGAERPAIPGLAQQLNGIDKSTYAEPVVDLGGRSGDPEWQRVVLHNGRQVGFVRVRASDEAAVRRATDMALGARILPVIIESLGTVANGIVLTASNLALGAIVGRIAGRAVLGRLGGIVGMRAGLVDAARGGQPSQYDENGVRRTYF